MTRRETAIPEFTRTDIERVRANALRFPSCDPLISNDDLSSLCDLADAALRSNRDPHRTIFAVGALTVSSAYEHLRTLIWRDAKHRRGHRMRSLPRSAIVAALANHVVDVATALDIGDMPSVRKHVANVILIALHLTIRSGYTLFDVAEAMNDRLRVQFPNELE